MYVFIYVDDIIITGSHSRAIVDLLEHLRCDFAVKDLGSLNFFLGVEILQQSDDILLSQRCYILDLLKRTDMLQAKLLLPCLTPSLFRLLMVMCFLILPCSVVHLALSSISR